MTQADNTPLPASIDMQYLPGRGLESYRLNTKVWSNSATSNVKVVGKRREAGKCRRC